MSHASIIKKITHKTSAVKILMLNLTANVLALIPALRTGIKIAATPLVVEATTIGADSWFVTHKAIK